jgi:hypothetical protein
MQYSLLDTPHEARIVIFVRPGYLVLVDCGIVIVHGVCLDVGHFVYKYPFDSRSHLGVDVCLDGVQVPQAIVRLSIGQHLDVGAAELLVHVRLQVQLAVRKRVWHYRSGLAASILLV